METDNSHVMSAETFAAIQKQFDITAPLYGITDRGGARKDWDAFKLAWNIYLESMGVTWDDWQLEMAILLEEQSNPDNYYSISRKLVDDILNILLDQDSRFALKAWIALKAEIANQ